MQSSTRPASACATIRLRWTSFCTDYRKWDDPWRRQPGREASLCHSARLLSGEMQLLDRELRRGCERAVGTPDHPGRLRGEFETQIKRHKSFLQPRHAKDLTRRDRE